MYDRDNKDTIWQRTEENMFTDILFDYKPFKHDACEETWEAYYTYGDPCFIDALRNCIKKVYRKGWKKIFGEYYYQFQRWSIAYDNMIGMSRDHLIYIFAALVKAGVSTEELHEYVSHGQILLNLGEQ